MLQYIERASGFSAVTGGQMENMNEFVAKANIEAIHLALASRERIVFMLVRTAVALGLVALAGYCLVKGVEFFAIPHSEAEKIGVDVLGLRLDAGGLGSVIFGSGIAIAFFAGRTAPKKVAASLHTPDAKFQSSA